MLKRVTAFFMAFVAVFFIFVDCTPRTKAVAPLVLVEAALASYVASCGYRLYTDNGTGYDVLGLLSDAFRTFSNETYASAELMLQLGNDGHVYSDNRGNIVLDNVSSDIFQDFADWLKVTYDVPINGSLPATVVDGASYSTFPRFQSSGVITVRDTLDPSVTLDYVFANNPRAITLSGNVRSAISNAISSYNNPIVCIQTFIESGNFGGHSPLTVYVFPAKQSYTCGSYYSGRRIMTEGSGNSGQAVYVNQIYSDVTGSYPLQYGRGVDSNFGWMVTCNVNAETTREPSLFANLANNIIDMASDVVTGKSLVLDVGASAGASATDIADTVATGYNGATGTLVVSSAVVSTDVIDTPVYPYPDFDDLGLPDLGLALVERFPFCIPYDFVHLVTLFDADPVAPYIRIDLFPSSFRQRIGLGSDQAVFYLDMTQDQYQTMGVIIRWGTLVGFCVGLLFITRKLIWSS